jgi:hypothetical protein
VLAWGDSCNILLLNEAPPRLRLQLTFHSETWSKSLKTIKLIPAVALCNIDRHVKNPQSLLVSDGFCALAKASR